MLPGVNPRQMKQLMKRMGMQQVEIPATEVIIRTEGKELVITDPHVAKVNMMGQETIQVTGEMHERESTLGTELSEDDVRTVVEQAGVSEEAARKALREANGDLAKAIMHLTGADDE